MPALVEWRPTTSNSGGKTVAAHVPLQLQILGEVELFISQVYQQELPKPGPSVAVLARFGSDPTLLAPSRFQPSGTWRPIEPGESPESARFVLYGA